MFSRLGNRVHGAEVLDLFSGSGALGFEALSRGASFVTFVENSRSALGVLRGNVSSLAAGDSTRIVGIDVFEFLDRDHAGGRTVDLLFADPPYGELAAATATCLITSETLKWADQALRVFECGVDDPTWPVPTNWRRWDERRYGKTRMVIEEKRSAGIEE